MSYLQKVGNLDLLTSQARLMALDVSPKHIGIAIAQGRTALPLSTIQRKKFSDDVAQLQTIIRDHLIQAIIIGLPVQMDGSEGRRAQSVRDFARILAETIPFPFAFWDERLTTKQAQRLERHRKKSPKMTDALAAMLILQAVLDHQHRSAP